MKISPLDYEHIRAYHLDGHTMPVTVVSKDTDFSLGDGIEFLRAWLANNQVGDLRQGWMGSTLQGFTGRRASGMLIRIDYFMKNIQNIVVAIAILVLFTGCVTWVSSMNQVSDGMTKKEVIAILGNPVSTASPGHGVEILRYNLDHAFVGWEEYYVKLVDGKVDSYGKMGDFDSTKDPTLNLNIKNR